MNKILFYFVETAKKMWFRCLLYCLLALFAIYAGYFFGDQIPDTLQELITKEGLNGILTIVASSMLAVTTFSLSILVQAFNAAASTASPRANKLLMENNTAQNALGTFIGAFLFSIVALIGTTSTLYSKGSIFVLFVFTALMIFLVILMLLRWIDQLSKLGRVTVTINMVEEALSHSIEHRAKHPYLCAHLLTQPIDELKKTGYPIGCEQVGYIQYIDIKKINTLAEKVNANIFILNGPGCFLDSVKAVAYCDKDLDDEHKKELINAFAIDDNRTFDQDPRYGFIILCEIALRALSPAVNDPGTAIDVLGTYIRSVKLWNDKKNIYLSEDKGEKENLVKYKNVFIHGIKEEDLLEDMYGPLLSEAAKHGSVSIRLKKSLLSIAALPDSLFKSHIQDWIDKLDSQCESFHHARRIDAIKNS